MAKRETLDQFTAAVAHAELIPAGRPLTVGETGDRLITFAPDVERVRRLCRELRRK